MHDVTRRRSLESLKKEAKRWLAALRENEVEARARFDRAMRAAPVSPGLRDVQHALAVEQGFAGWTALQQEYLLHAAAASETIAHYETKVAALLDAYRTGTPEAMERHWRLTWHRRAWTAMRTYVQVGLGKAASDDLEITLDDAQWLVAREHGFEDWSALRSVVSTVAQPALLMRKPMALLAAADDALDRKPIMLSISREWEELLEESRESDVQGLDAHAQMTDALLKDVVALSNLTTLKLGGSQGVTDEGVLLLAQMPKLRHLDLSGTAITDRGIAALRNLTSLRFLSLAWTRVTDAGVAALSGLSQGEHVDVSGTHCGDGAIRAFAGKPTLRHFLSGQATTDDGVALFHEYPVFKQWQGGDVKMALLSYDTEPNRLLLRGQITDRGVARLRGLDGLFGLNLDDSALAVTGDALAPLIELPHLGWLAFDAKDDAMPHIAHMPHLRFLGCQDTPATDRGWAALGQSQSIEQIWGRRCYGLEREGFLSLSRMPRLKNLSVSCKNVDDVGVSSLPDFPALRELMPMDVPDAGYRHIGRCAALESLVLMYCRDTTDAATEHLVELRQLARYFASYTQITDRTPELLSRIDSLEHVTFDSCAGLTNNGIAHLARLPKLREVRVSGRRLTSSVKSAFGPGVTVHYSL